MFDEVLITEVVYRGQTDREKALGDLAGVFEDLKGADKKVGR